MQVERAADPSASLGMTKGRAVIPYGLDAGQRTAESFGLNSQHLRNGSRGESPAVPLSSRTERSDLLFSPPANGRTWKRRPPLCHPSEAEGSAVSLHLL